MRQGHGPDENEGLTPLQEAVSALLSSRGLESAADLAGVMAAWPEVAGEELAARASPAALRGGELVVEVEDAAWGTQVTLLGGELLRRFHEQLGGPVVTRLVVRVKPRSNR